MSDVNLLCCSAGELLALARIAGKCGRKAKYEMRHSTTCVIWTPGSVGRAPGPWLWRLTACVLDQLGDLRHHYHYAQLKLLTLPHELMSLF
jgi:hypothetical protein